MRLFGKAGGEHYWNMAHAVDEREVHDDVEAKSISHETTFFSDVQDRDTLERTLLWLADKVAARLRRHEVVGTIVTLKYRTENFKTFTRRKTLGETVDDTNVIFETAKVLMSRLRDKKGKVRLLGVGVSGLEPVKDVQLTLFGDEKKLKSRATEDAVDQVRKRFGKGAIIRGSLLEDE
jgi:DNA polymerase-4